MVDSLKSVEVVEIRHSREELVSSAHPASQCCPSTSKRGSLKTNDNPPLSALLDLKHFNDGSTPPLDFIHDILVDSHGVVGSLFEESGIGDASNIRDSLFVLDGSRGRKDTSSDKVASELLRDSGRNGTGRSVSFHSERLFGSAVVEVKLVDPADQ